MSESKSFLWDYLSRLLHRWYVVLIGFAFGVFGFVKDGLGWNIPMPSGFWWVAGLTALLVSQVWVYRDLYRQYEAMLSPEADCTLAQVVEQIIEREATRVEPSNALMSALVQLRQKALFKSISVWARAGRDIDPLEPVPADIWGAYQVDYIAYLRDERGKLEATKGLTQAGYIDFHFNCEQIARYWPVVFDAVCIARLRGYAEAMRRLRKADVRESLGAGSGRQRDNPFSLGRQERADDRDEKLMARL